MWEAIRGTPAPTKIPLLIATKSDMDNVQEATSELKERIHKVSVPFTKSNEGGGTESLRFDAIVTVDESTGAVTIQTPGKGRKDFHFEGSDPSTLVAFGKLCLKAAELSYNRNKPI